MSDEEKTKEPEPSEPTIDDVFITFDYRQAIAHQIRTSNTRLFKVTINVDGSDERYAVARTQHRATLGAAAALLTIQPVSERERTKMLEAAFPDLVQRADGFKQKQFQFPDSQE